MMNHVTIANTINNQFVKVSSSILPLDLGILEAFLPAKEPPPSFTLSLGCVCWAQKGQTHQSNWPRWNFAQTCERICLWVEFTCYWYFKLFIQRRSGAQAVETSHIVVPIPKTKPPGLINSGQFPWLNVLLR